MLILTRTTEQAVLIGEDIVVKVLSVSRGQVRLGITAPKHVPIDREESREPAAPAAPESTR